ncbi:MAG: SRPBCC family protein [Acidimicrobiales bacterium]
MIRHGDFTVTIDRPIEAVFEFLADGENDKRFSRRIIEINKTTDGPVGVGTVYRSKARDLGRTATHDIEITAFERPTLIRWRELTTGPVVIADGGNALRDVGGMTALTFHGDLQGRGLGNLILAFASSRVRSGFPRFAQSIKETIESSA